MVRRLLAVLLCRANHEVPVDVLLEQLWSADVPPSGRQALHVCVHRLRRVLDEPERIVRGADGYLLRVGPDEVDAQRFIDIVELARKARDGGQAQHAGELFRAALALWRGEPYGEADDTELVAEEARWLSEARLTAIEERIELELRLGRDVELVGELEGLVAAYPFRERAPGQLMIALYRCGRRVDAMAVFRSARARLVDELGVEPGPELRGLHDAVLGDEAWLRPPAAPEPRRPRNDLPADPGVLLGREKELGLLTAGPERAHPALWAIDGMPGVGKTALAVRAAHQVAERYPDGRLFLDLRGHHPTRSPTEPSAALSSLLAALGVPAEQTSGDEAELAARWRAELAERRCVVLLDDARDAAQVRALLPGAADCLLLVTSRRRLVGLAGTPLSLDTLSEVDATAVLAREVGAERTGAEPAAVGRIVAACGRLPLALQIVAARLRHRPDWTMQQMAQRLADARHQLDELSAEDVTVAAALRLSYQQLDERRRLAYRRLGSHPGTTFDLPAAAVLTGYDRHPAGRLLEELVDMHLLEPAGSERYRMHDLVRAHARLLASEQDAETERLDMLKRLLDYYLHAVVAAVDVLTPVRPQIDFPMPPAPRTLTVPENRERAREWLGSERHAVVQAVQAAAHAGLATRCWQLGYAMWWFCYFDMHLDDWERMIAVGLPAARMSGDLRGVAIALTGRGMLLTRRGRPDEALSALRDASALFQRLGDWRGIGVTELNIGEQLTRLGRYPEAIAELSSAISRFAEVDDDSSRAGAHAVLGHALRGLGRHEDAAASYRLAREHAERVDDTHRATAAECGLGRVYAELGEFERARRHLEAALRGATRAGSAGLYAGTLSCLGILERCSGRPAVALRHHNAALDHGAKLGDLDWHAGARNEFAATLLAVGERGRALQESRRAHRLAISVSSHHQEVLALSGIAQAHRLAGETDVARDNLNRALVIATDLDLPEVDGIRAGLAAVGSG